VDIPYTTAARPDTGVNNPTLGIWLFLSSEIMLFGSLFSAYALIRGGAGQWPDQSSVLSVPLGAINTALLVLSSITLGRALSALRSSTNQVSRADLHGPRTYRLFMGATILLGLVFLGIKGFEWNDKLAHGLVPSTNNFLGLYFTMTGVHAAHLVAGILINAYLFGPGMRLWRTEPERYVGRIAVARLYWNLVDAVWMALFVVLYLL
jgi:heme/copper-type cytochrome/quinol oxidase subunit 3